MSEGVGVCLRWLLQISKRGSAQLCEARPPRTCTVKNDVALLLRSSISALGMALGYMNPDDDA